MGRVCLQTRGLAGTCTKGVRWERDRGPHETGDDALEPSGSCTTAEASSVAGECRANSPSVGTERSDALRRRRAHDRPEPDRPLVAWRPVSDPRPDSRVYRIEYVDADHVRLTPVSELELFQFRQAPPMVGGSCAKHGGFIGNGCPICTAPRPAMTTSERPTDATP